ncbi:ATP-binding cassette domain-containing protein [Engelhardtia mirabilis]|uniref:ATP-binding protein Uup n=1 Tax=Engelhardtia mirabilis TaxID=2528011 RepID=A0A518BGH1_9BACT|nr:ABC transporter ATP-binding protein uup [Planctomycetes bacterium Pla133]QDV00392.1 ABC transporter ATP-binding protein uup [Planctomycetes bacterium Pla86]
MAELGFQDLTFSRGGAPLLDGTALHIEKGERLGLLGRNGSGKSTLMALLAGELVPDEGQIVRRPGLVVARLAQEVPKTLRGTVSELLHEALADVEVAGDWEAEQRIGDVTAKLGLVADEKVADMSAGSKRRVLLARALVMEPDVLLLDEPTNHLDIEAIRGLEELLLRRGGSALFVTHDRTFLQRVATSIVDLDRGALRRYDCDYQTYLERKESELEAERGQRAEFDKKLAKEEAWLRQGIKARRTRNMGRVRSLLKLREERAERRKEAGRVKVALTEADRTGQVVMRADGLTMDFGAGPVVNEFSIEIQRGDRIGLVGPNGCGKTTLVQLLLKELSPTAGAVQHGTNFQVARFDQLHSTLDDSLTIQENVCGDGDTVFVGGGARNVMGYLMDFLFTREQIRGSIKHLSGGERNRVQLAKLLARPCNVLVLDEPTNDLDLETLEILEELLAEFQGTLLLVSHDRAFLDNVVTSTLVFEGRGRFREYVGGYEEYRRASERAAAPKAKKAKPAKQEPKAAKPRKLTYGERLELEKLPERLEALEAEKSTLEKSMGDPDFYRRPGEEISAATDKLKSMEVELARVYARWEELEALASA